MKTKMIVTALASLILTHGFAQVENHFNVLVRKEKGNKTKYVDVSLPDLVSSTSFDGKFFKVVRGKENEAIRFDDSDKLLVLKAANAYYHLSKARNFWVETMNSSKAKNQKKMIVRVEITNQFDELGHFANDNREPQFNNALSIPAGETPHWVPADRQAKWQEEIWFRPLKKIETKSLPKLPGDNPMTGMLKDLEQPVINYSTNRFNQSMFENIFYPLYAERPLWENAVRFVGTIALTKAIIEASKLLDNLFIEKYYYLDTAMVPEIIYHEYAHIILSDHLAMSHSTPVVEGMADYFAAVIANKKQMYHPVKGFSNATPKKRNHKRFYLHWEEMNERATSDFVLAVLWDVREILGAETANKVIFEARRDMETQSATIYDHMLRAIINSCKDNCALPSRDKLKLYKTFLDRGF